MTWPQSVAINLLPLSVANSLPAAFREWTFQDKVRDLLEEYGDYGHCEMCDHQHVRWHFLISNSSTNGHLWTGSTCITRFGVVVHDGSGQQLDAPEDKDRFLQKKVRSLIQRQRYEKAEAALQLLISRDPDKRGMLTRFRDRGAFTPMEALLLLGRCQKYGGDLHPSTLKIRLRRDREKDQVKTLNFQGLEKLLPAFSPPQIKRVLDWRPEMTPVWEALKQQASVPDWQRG